MSNGFNTFSTNRVDSSASSAGSGSSIYSRAFTPARLGDAAFSTAANGNAMEGFSGDRDYVVLPVSAGTNIEYYNNADALQWSVTLANISGVADNWVGFTFDDTDSLIYVVAVDEGPAPNDYFLASVNSAGTVTPIGVGAAPVSDFTDPTGNWWSESGVTSSSSSIQRAADGSGNIFIRAMQSAAPNQEAEINIATGAFVSDPADISASDNSMPLTYKTADGVYCGINYTAQVFGINMEMVSSTSSGTAKFNSESGLPTGSLKLTYWKNNVYAVINNAVLGTNATAPRIYPQASFDATVKSAATVIGII